MGCSGSKSLRSGDLCDLSSSVFKVIILNTRGHDCAVGHIEVTSRELLLHQLGKPSICWPLAGLRHYGFNEDLFSFESGRRCPTGEGIYAFRCNRAESLFSVLEERILQAAEQSNRRLAAHQATLLARFHSETSNMADSRILRPNNHNMYVNTRHDYENRNPMVGGDAHGERFLFDDDGPPLRYADLDLPMKQSDDQSITCANCDPASIENQCSGEIETSTSKKRSAYMNILYENLCSDDHHVESPECGEVKRRSLSASLKRCYVNSSLITKLMDSGKGKDDTQSSAGRGTLAQRRSSSRRLSGTSCGKERTCVGYAAIDFERTHALNSSRHVSVADENDGVRKTRHSVSTGEEVDQ